jgi:hypothetical protein
MVRADGQEVLPAIASHVRWFSKTRESSPILPLTEPEGRGKGPLLLCWPSSFFWRGSCVRLFGAQQRAQDRRHAIRFRKRSRSPRWTSPMDLSCNRAIIWQAKLTSKSG